MEADTGQKNDKCLLEVGLGQIVKGLVCQLRLLKHIVEIETSRLVVHCLLEDQKGRNQRREQSFASDEFMGNENDY